MPAKRGRNHEAPTAIRPIGQPINDAVSAMLKDRTGRANRPRHNKSAVQCERDYAERDTGDAAAVRSVLAGAVDAGREPCGAGQIARKNDDG